MRRRAFIAGLASAAAGPLVANAQERIRRVGVLMMYEEGDPEAQLRVAAFQEGLAAAGWTPRNLQVVYQWGLGDADWVRARALDLVKLAPDVIVANGPAIRPAKLVAGTMPLVFVGVSEPVALGIVSSLARPGGTVTGFSNIEPTIGAKWVELLKRIAPDTTRSLFIFNPSNSGAVQQASEASAGLGLAVQVEMAKVSDPADIEAAITRFGATPGGSLVIPPEPFTTGHRALIVSLATRLRLPWIAAVRAVAVDGGLMSYGINLPNLFRQAAGYVDRILRGEKPGDLPVQQPAKYEMVINARTAKALGLAVPQTLLVAADEVIE